MSKIFTYYDKNTSEVVFETVQPNWMDITRANTIMFSVTGINPNSKQIGINIKSDEVINVVTGKYDKNKKLEGL